MLTVFHKGTVSVIVPRVSSSHADAGLTVGLMLVPQCLAFALLAGLPIRAGLYSSFAPLVIYALLGSWIKMPDDDGC